MSSSLDPTLSTTATTSIVTRTVTASTTSAAANGSPNFVAATQQGQQSDVEKAEKFWLSRIQEWYPDRHTKTYLMPPVRFNRVNCSVLEVSEGMKALVLQSSPQEASQQQVPRKERRQRTTLDNSQQPDLMRPMWSNNPGSRVDFPKVPEDHIKDDTAMDKVRRSLRVLGEVQEEPMMVVSDLKFQGYLGGATSPVERAVCARLLRATDVKRQGDFDIIIIHRLYGFILGEVKSVDRVSDIKVRVKKAVDQLNVSQKALNHVSSDLAPVRVMKTVILPNITSSQLLQELSKDKHKQLSEALMACVGGHDLLYAVSRCLCADDLPTTECLNAVESMWGRQLLAVQHRLPWLRGRMTHCLQDWWRRNVLHAGLDPFMTDGVYDRLLARFCGPASTVEISTPTTPRMHVPFRTQGQAVAQTGLRMSQLALYPDQVDVLNNPPSPCVFLFGPPGCGKTVLLVLKAVEWLIEGHNVQLVSVRPRTRAVSFLIEAQINMIVSNWKAAAQPHVGTLHRRSLSIYEDAADALRQCAVETLVAAQSHDKSLHIVVDEVISGHPGRFTQFIMELQAHLPKLSLWAAGVYHPALLSTVDLPPWLCVKALSVPIRCPPAVLQEIKLSHHFRTRFITGYTSPACPMPTDRLTIEWLAHKGQRGHCHDGKDRPLQCEECGRCVGHLLDKLHGDGQDLHWRDVIIVCGNVRVSASDGLVLGLQQSGVPVAVVDRHSDDAQLRDLALGTSDIVMISDCDAVSGLERRIVVALSDGSVADRMFSISRCTSQLVCIDELGL